MRGCLSTSEAIFFRGLNSARVMHRLGMYLYRVSVMVLNATYNNISIISWRSVSLVEETGVPGRNKRPVACR